MVFIQTTRISLKLNNLNAVNSLRAGYKKQRIQSDYCIVVKCFVCVTHCKSGFLRRIVGGPAYDPF